MLLPTPLIRPLRAAQVAHALAAIACLLGAGFAAAQTTPNYPSFGGARADWKATPDLLVQSQDPAVVQGAYLARAGDCIACHTADKGAPYAGGLGLDTPFGVIYSTNITPDTQHGIGAYTLEEFSRALRKGVAKDGRHLYPAMPYPSYSKISDADIASLYTYFMHGVKPDASDNKANGLGFPFNMRGLMAGWNLLYLPTGVYQNDNNHDAQWNRGAYLVEGLEHCGSCHTPRGIAQQEKAMNDRGSKVFLSGANLSGWHASSLRGDEGAGLGRWNTQELIDFLRAGRNAHTAPFGAMTEAIGDSTQYLSTDDLTAIAVYLKTLAAKDSPHANTPANAYRKVALADGVIESAGAGVYLNNCNACHRSDGKGASGVFPALDGNSAVLSPDPTSLIHVVLSGSHMPSTSAAPAPLGMPGFGWRLNDQQVADVLTFVRSSWSNAATPTSAVTPEDVAKLRTELKKVAAGS